MNENELLQLIDEASDTEHKELNLSWKGLESVPTEVFALRHLEVLNLSYNHHLSELPDELAQLTALHTVDLSGTRIHEMPAFLSKLPNLKVLHMSFTPIQELAELIGDIPSLEVLDLSYTKLEHIPETLGHLVNLRELHLSFTPLSTLPKSLPQLVNLESLGLGRTKLTEVPNSVTTLKSLRSLHLSGTMIKELPNNIAELSELRTLRISGTLIDGLPKGVGNLKYLEILDLSGTKLIQLPDIIGHLSKLKTLNLGHTQLATVPESLGYLSNLQILDLSQNALTKLPNEMGNLLNLRELTFEGNPLAYPPPEILRKGLLGIIYFLKTNLEGPTARCFLHIPCRARTSFKQYFNFFPEFMNGSKQHEVHFEVTGTSKGLRLECKLTPDLDLVFLDESFQEFLHFCVQEPSRDLFLDGPKGELTHRRLCLQRSHFLQDLDLLESKVAYELEDKVELLNISTPEESRSFPFSSIHFVGISPN